VGTIPVASAQRIRFTIVSLLIDVCSLSMTMTSNPALVISSTVHGSVILTKVPITLLPSLSIFLTLFSLIMFLP